MSAPDPRRGPTLIEVVVIVIILVTLFALLMPQHAHDSRIIARRQTCKDNLRQIGMAMQAYHDVHRSLPPGSLPNGATWSILLLPYLDQKDLYDSFNFGVSSILAADVPDADMTRIEAAATELSSFMCASETAPETIEGVGRSNYVANFGPQAPSAGSIRDTTQDGPFGFGSAVTMKQITDGVSYTILVGERRTEGTGPDRDNLAVWSSPVFFGLDRAALTWGWGVDPINAGNGGTPKPGSFSSPHEGGAQFCMADGSVHFISESIDTKSTGIDSTQGVFQNLLDYADGQKLGEY